VGIATAIGVIISMLKSAGNGLKKLGAALKTLGKKMGAAVPGLLGSVLSLVLKTGGELLKFVGNNIWILVVALGMVFLKEIKKR
jgi:fructose-1,6-bisphosphatase